MDSIFTVVYKIDRYCIAIKHTFNLRYEIIPKN